MHITRPDSETWHRATNHFLLDNYSCGVMLLGMVLYMMTSRTVPLAALDLDMELPW